MPCVDLGPRVLATAWKVGLPPFFPTYLLVVVVWMVSVVAKETQPLEATLRSRLWKGGRN